jgi:hypothetical protein
MILFNLFIIYIRKISEYLYLSLKLSEPDSLGIKRRGVWSYNFAFI